MPKPEVKEYIAVVRVEIVQRRPDGTPEAMTASDVATYLNGAFDRAMRAEDPEDCVVDITVFTSIQDLEADAQEGALRTGLGLD